MNDLDLEIPQCVPVMTLRGVVLFPRAMMPLRIFEDRYRQMLDQCLSENRMFAIFAEREDVSHEEEHLELSHPIGTIGLVRVSKKHDDGTSFVLLQGLRRVKIKSITQEHPYRILEVEAIDSIIDDSMDHFRTQLSRELKRNMNLGGAVTSEMIEFLTPLEDNDAFVDLTAYSIFQETLVKQTMLEENNLSARTSMLLDELTNENDRLTLVKEALDGNREEDIGYN